MSRLVHTFELVVCPSYLFSFPSQYCQLPALNVLTRTSIIDHQLLNIFSFPPPFSCPMPVPLTY